MQPQVRNLQDVQAQLQQSINPQLGLIDESIAQNATAGQAQEAGLRATADQTYKDIEQASVDKGMFFSGFSPAEQAKYNSTTFLPALANLQSTIAQTRTNLLGKKADLNTSIFDKAFNTVEQDRALLADWNKMTAQQQFEASQADKQRVFQAQQSEADRQASAREGAANRASSGSAQAQPREIFSAALSERTGKDGKVSPGVYKSLRNQWITSGYGKTKKSFDDVFWKSYVNESNGQWKSYI